MTSNHWPGKISRTTTHPHNNSPLSVFLRIYLRQVLNFRRVLAADKVWVYFDPVKFQKPLPMILDTLFGLTSVICFSLPIAAILFFRLFRHVSLIALMVYYTLTILRCLSSSSIPPSPDFKNSWEVLFNYIEIPLMLSALLFFCPAKQRKQKIHFLIGFFIAYEVLIALLYGFSPSASLYIMVPGLLVIVLYSLFLFLRQVKFTILHRKNTGRVLMLGALVFSYSCYLFLFYAYFMLEMQNIAGIYGLFFLSSSISAVIMSMGLFLMRNRIRELQELKVTRRELQMVFGT
jgi:uncharacterized protein with PQ loop repeat